MLQPLVDVIVVVVSASETRYLLIASTARMASTVDCSTDCCVLGGAAASLAAEIVVAEIVVAEEDVAVGESFFDLDLFFFF